MIHGPGHSSEECKVFYKFGKNGHPHGYQNSASMPEKNQDNKNQKVNFECDPGYFW